MENSVSVDTTGEHKYYSALQVFFASFFGGPFAGALYLARSQRFFGREDLANMTMKVGWGLTLAMGLLLGYLPESTPNSLIPALYSGVFSMQVTQLVKQSGQSAQDLKHAKGSTLKMLGMSIGILIVTLAYWLAVIFLLAVAGLLPEAGMGELDVATP